MPQFLSRKSRTRPAEAAAASSSGGPGSVFDINIVDDSGPQLQLLAWDGSDWSNSGDPIEPDVEGNDALISDWNADEAITTGGLKSALNDCYYAAWKLTDTRDIIDPDDPWSFSGHTNVDPYSSGDFYIAVGIFRSADGTDFNHGAGVGMSMSAGNRKVAMPRNNGWTFGGSFLNMESQSGAIITSQEGIIIGAHARDVKSNGQDGSRDQELDAPESTVGTGEFWLVLFICGSTTIPGIEVQGTISPWKGW